MTSSQNFFVWFCGVWFASGVWYPAEQNSVGYQTPQNKILGGMRPHSTKYCRVSDPAEQWQSCVHFIADTFSARSDTLQNNVLPGLIPRLTKSSGVSDPAEQSPEGYHTRGRTFKYEYFCKFEIEFKNILGCEFGDYMGSIHGKNRW
jgi:hypothetical protein